MIWRKRKAQRENAQAEADQALRESVDHLHATVRRGREVRRVADRLREIQRENHFAESIRHVYSGGRS
ncbi:hypothetical protein [Isoptericola sp. NPDC056605]|uniref:DUF7620 family protein n=1 Tax=Isoptericola sp. NPDC056605 TaxID=3345876 RepID=UPI0036B74DC5